MTIFCPEGKSQHQWWWFWWSWEFVCDVWQRQGWHYQSKGNSNGIKMPWNEDYIRTGLKESLERNSL